MDFSPVIIQEKIRWEMWANLFNFKVQTKPGLQFRLEALARSKGKMGLTKPGPKASPLLYETHCKSTTCISLSGDEKAEPLTV